MTDFDEESAPPGMVLGISMLDILSCGLGAAAFLGMLFVTPAASPPSSSSTVISSGSSLSVWIENPGKKIDARWSVIVTPPGSATPIEIDLRNRPLPDEKLSGYCTNISWITSGPMVIYEPTVGVWSFAFRWIDTARSTRDVLMENPMRAPLEVRIIPPHSAELRFSLAPVKFGNITNNVLPVTVPVSYSSLPPAHAP